MVLVEVVIMFIHTYIERHNFMNIDWFAAAFNADAKKLTEIKEWCYNTMKIKFNSETYKTVRRNFYQ